MFRPLFALTVILIRCLEQKQIGELLNILIHLIIHPLILQDFGSIYATLLPGARAKLAPPEGRTVLDGLEVKVGFGEVWKDSLSELSGGQRYVQTRGYTMA